GHGLLTYRIMSLWLCELTRCRLATSQVQNIGNHTRVIHGISMASIRAPRWANKRVLCPSPQPISRPFSLAMSGSAFRKAGVFSRKKPTHGQSSGACRAGLRGQKEPGCSSIIDRAGQARYFSHRTRRFPMDVHLTPELEQLVQDKVQSGRYSSASEVVREA